MNLEQKIEAVLFFKAEPIKIEKLAQLTESSEEEVRQALEELKNKMDQRGITIVSNGEKVEMTTSQLASELIDKISKEELSSEIGKAGLETLSIVLYQAPISKPEIDYIRGVNSGFILRNLQIRGLVERQPKPEDSRTYIYKPTLELLAHLGINNLTDLPEVDLIKSQIEKIMTQNNDGPEAQT